jgi:hydroxymethylbilane synthase
MRRRAQLLAVRPDLEIVEVRGNVDTRLRKLAAGEVDALVLARAGLERLGRLEEAGGVLKGEVFVPAAGQGVLALEARNGDEGAAAAAAAVQDPTAWACLRAERALVRTLGANATAHWERGRSPWPGTRRSLPGNSQEEEGRRRVPQGGATSSRPRTRRCGLTAWVGAPDGASWIRDELSGDADDPEALGAAVAGRLLSAGAAELLAR